ncbi:hypothetical protein [Amycolatopsis japonica]
MARGNIGRVRATRSAGLLPVVLALTSAALLTGAAVYTVDRAGCVDPGQYIRHDNHIELVGGCVDGSELPAAPQGTSHEADAKTGVTPSNFRP